MSEPGREGSRTRIPWGSLVFLLVAADLVSLWLLFGAFRDAGQGGIASFFLVVLYVILAIMVGSWAIRIVAGLSLGGAVNAMRNARPPDDHLLNALLAFIGGVLLIVPGLVSDAVGLLLVLPPSRALVRRLVRRRRPPTRTRDPLEVDDYRVE